MFIGLGRKKKMSERFDNTRFYPSKAVLLPFDLHPAGLTDL